MHFLRSSRYSVAVGFLNWYSFHSCCLLRAKKVKSRLSPASVRKTLASSGFGWIGLGYISSRITLQLVE